MYVCTSTSHQLVTEHATTTGSKSKIVVLLALGFHAVFVSRTSDSLSLLVTIKQDFTFVLDELAKVVALPEGLERGLLGVCVVIADEGFQVLCGFGSVVYEGEYDQIRSNDGRRRIGHTERHLREKVVHDMEVSHIMKEKASLPAQKVPVDCSSGSTLEVPFFTAVVRECRVSVVEVSDHDDY